MYLRRNDSSSLTIAIDSGAGATLIELRMRRSPSMMSAETGHDTYLVLEDLGRFGWGLARDR
jgi:hypothetical protein